MEATTKDLAPQKIPFPMIELHRKKAGLNTGNFSVHEPDEVKVAGKDLRRCRRRPCQKKPAKAGW